MSLIPWNHLAGSLNIRKKEAHPEDLSAIRQIVLKTSRRWTSRKWSIVLLNWCFINTNACVSTAVWKIKIKIKPRRGLGWRIHDERCWPLFVFPQRKAGKTAPNVKGQMFFPFMNTPSKFLTFTRCVSWRGSSTTGFGEISAAICDLSTVHNSKTSLIKLDLWLLLRFWNRWHDSLHPCDLPSLWPFSTASLYLGVKGQPSLTSQGPQTETA